MNILFMCVANSARSQLAEGLAKQLLPGCTIESAGSHPGKLNPMAVQAMQEIGVDISKHYSKSVAQLPPEFVTKLDYVITLCAEEVCPAIISQAERQHWPLPDPATQDLIPEAVALQKFREVRESIYAKINEFKVQSAL